MKQTLYPKKETWIQRHLVEIMGITAWVIVLVVLIGIGMWLCEPRLMGY